MATSQDQVQQQQPQPLAVADPAAAPAAEFTNTAEPADTPKPFLAVQREALRANVASRGKRIVCTQAMALVTTTILGTLCLMAFWQTDSTCNGGPVGLRYWYLGAFVLECFLFVCFFSVMYSVLTVWSWQVVGVNAALPAEQGGAGDSGESSCAIYSSFALTLVAFFVVIWSIVGLFAQRDGGSCDSGNGYFWYIYPVMWVSILCCTGGSTADTYRLHHRSEGPQPREVTV